VVSSEQSPVSSGENASSRHVKRNRLAPLEPTFVAAVASIDPSNFATNIEAGARFGYFLLWVFVASNLIVMLIQTLTAKLGLETGRNLAELCREKLPWPITLAMWV